MNSASFLPFLSAFVVFPLLLLERFFPFPYLLEEAFKFAGIYFLLAKEKRKIFYAFLSGIAFSISETFLYFSLISINQGITTLVIRLAVLTTFHTTTFCLMAYFYTKGRKMILLAFIGSIIIHYLYNLAVPLIW